MSLALQVGLGALLGVGVIVILSLLPPPATPPPPSESDDGSTDSKATRAEEAQEAARQEVLLRRARLREKGIDVDKISRLVQELDEESETSRNVGRLLLVALQFLFIVVLGLVLWATLSSYGVSLATLFPREMALLHGDFLTRTTGRPNDEL